MHNYSISYHHPLSPSINSSSTTHRRSLNTKLQHVLERSRALLVHKPGEDVTNPSRYHRRDGIDVTAASNNSSSLVSSSVSSIGACVDNKPDGESSRLINAPGADSWAQVNQLLRSLGFEAVPVIAGSSRLGEPTLVDGRKLFETYMNVLQEYAARNRQLLAAATSSTSTPRREGSDGPLVKIKDLTRVNMKLQEEIEKLRRELDDSKVENSSTSLTNEARTKELERLKARQAGEIRQLQHQCQRQEIEIDRMRKTMLKIADDEQIRQRKDREFADKAVKSICSGDRGVKNQGNLQLLHELAAVYRRRIEKLEKEIIASGRQTQDLANQLTSTEEEVRRLQQQLSISTEDEDSLCDTDKDEISSRVGGDAEPFIDKARALEQSLCREIAERERSEMKAKEREMEYTTKIAELERQLNTTRYELSAAEATLADRPTVKEVQLLKNKIERMEKGKEERDRWKNGDVREMIRRDKESYKLGADIAVAEMDECMIEQVLIDCCRHLQISEPTLLPEALKKLGDVLETALPRMRDFVRFVTSTVCSVESRKSAGEGKGLAAFAPMDIVEARLKRLLKVEKELTEARHQLALVESALDGEPSSDLPLDARISSLLEELRDRRTTENAFGVASERLYSVDEPHLITDRIVKHYMTTFGVNELERVCGNMTQSKQRWTELENFWKALCSEVLKVDPAKVSTAKAMLIAQNNLSKCSTIGG